MKKFILLFVLFTTLNTMAQHTEVRFREQTFDNGMNYPQVIIPACKTCEDSINSNIRFRISDLEASDFCIGQYGYVQKSTHLQIHIFCNCIDFEESQNRFLLYNIDEGKDVPYSDLFSSKKTKEVGLYLADQIKNHARNKSLTISDELTTSIQKDNLDVLKVEMTKDGLNIWLPEIKEWGEEPAVIKWIELKPFLKYHFI